MGRKHKEVILTAEEKERLLDSFHDLFVLSDGWQAYNEGQSIDTNPHTPDSDEYALWRDGWRDAKTCDEEANGNPYGITITERAQ